MTERSEWKQKMTVGELGFWTGNNRTASVRALDFVTAYEIKYPEFMEILQSSTKEDVVSSLHQFLCK
jgi:CRP-like cAMP-binding protein